MSISGTRFNNLMSSHFNGCPFLCSAPDLGRNRTMRFYALPDEQSLVGMSDGTDAFIVPVVCRSWSFDIRTALKDIVEGRKPQLPEEAPVRRKLLAAAIEEAPVRRRLIEPVLRKRLHV